MWVVRKFQTYVNSRMDGLYGCSVEKQFPTLIPSRANYLPPFDKMPKLIQTVIGLYGNEIYGSLCDTDSYMSEHLNLLRKYIENKSTDPSITLHQYVDDLPEYERLHIYDIIHGKIYNTIHQYYPTHSIIPIYRMNEIYVSSIGAQGSDRVFESPHVDGIFASLLSLCVPGTTVLRCVIGIQGNNSIDTIFPLSGNSYTLDTGHFLAFDYNHSIHYITQIPRTHDRRVRMILKLHYIVFPAYLPRWIGKRLAQLHAKYNATLRQVFLRSQVSRTNPHDIHKMPNRISDLVNNGTHLYLRLFLCGLFLWKWMGFSA